MDCFDNLIEDAFRVSEEASGFDLILDNETAWLESLMGVGLLNDCMLTSGLDLEPCFGSEDLSCSPYIQSEHSYSLCRAATLAAVSLMENDQESQLLMMVDPNLAMSLDDDASSTAESSENIVVEEFEVKSEPQVDDSQQTEASEESAPSSTEEDILIDVTSASSHVTPTIVLTYQPTTRLVSRPPTIIVTKAFQPYSGGIVRRNLSGFVQQSGVTGAQGSVLKVTRGAAATGVRVMRQANVGRAEQTLDVRCEAVQETYNDEGAHLPPSPPNSDGEGMSPKQESPSPPHIYWTQRMPDCSSLSALSDQPSRSHISPSGRLVLTEEERRTLIAEGYPVPTRLPLTKQEENNLKKVQRKIKNKMSAQESRRKKKDYVETLEKKLEVSHQENSHLKKQLETLQSDHRLLQSQLQKLQSLANKLKPSVEMSTCLMVFALFFALFTGTCLSPVSLAHLGASRAGESSLASGGPRPDLGEASGSGASGGVRSSPDDYRTPNIKSRTLMSMTEDDDSHQSSTSRELFIGWLSSLTCAHKSLGDHQSADDSDIDYTFIDQSGHVYAVSAGEGFNGSSAEYGAEEVVEGGVAPELVVYTQSTMVNITYPTTAVHSAAV